MIEEVLKKIGLHDTLIAVYMAVLQLGPSPVRKIARQANINSGTAHELLTQLHQEGLISHYYKGENQYFVAEDPSRLCYVSERRLQQLGDAHQQLKKMIPELQTLTSVADYRSVVKYYEGVEGINAILKDVIDSCRVGEKKYFAYSSASVKNYLYYGYELFSEDRIKAGISVQTISIGAGGETRGLDERKWLSTELSASSYTLIYEGKVAMISVNQKGIPMGLIIEDESIYQTQKLLFEFTWKQL